MHVGQCWGRRHNAKFVRENRWSVPPDHRQEKSLNNDEQYAQSEINRCRNHALEYQSLIIRQYGILTSAKAQIHSCKVLKAIGTRVQLPSGIRDGQMAIGTRVQLPSEKRLGRWRSGRESSCHRKISPLVVASPTTPDIVIIKESTILGSVTKHNATTILCRIGQQSAGARHSI